MVKLHSRGIFKDILEGWGESQQIVRDPPLSHFREGVVHQTSIQTSNKSTYLKAVFYVSKYIHRYIKRLHLFILQ